ELYYDIVFFFFSSRRRHTRFSRDWSSDMCSSDLGIDDGVDRLDLAIGDVQAEDRDQSVLRVERHGPGLAVDHGEPDADAEPLQRGHPHQQGPCHPLPAVEGPAQRGYLATTVAVQRHILRQ